MFIKSSSARVLGLFLALLAVAAFVVFHQASRKSEQELVREFTARGQQTLEVVQWLLAEKAPYQNLDKLRERTAELSDKLGLRITYISGGKVLAESNLPPSDTMKMDDHSTRPEVKEALEKGFGAYPRYSTTVGQRLFYLAKRIQGIPGLPDGVLRIAEPYSMVQTVISETRADILKLVVIMAVAAAALGVVLVMRSRKELADFASEVKRIGATGSVPDKLRVYPGQEYKPLADSINVLARKARRSMRRLHDTRSQLEAVLANMTDAVAILDHDGTIMLGNAALEALLKSGGDIPEGKDALEAGLGADVFRAIVAALRADAPAPRRFQARLTRGGHADVDLVPYSTVKGKRRFILVLHDVTAMKNTENLLRDFVIDASHRLRTPLTSIQGYADTLLDSPPNDQGMMRNMIGIIAKKSQEMAGVVTELLHRASPQAAMRDAGKDNPVVTTVATQDPAPEERA